MEMGVPRAKLVATFGRAPAVLLRLPSADKVFRVRYIIDGIMISLNS